MGATRFVRDRPPYFNSERYERDCPYCDGELKFHWAELRDAPRGGLIVHIVSKCLTAGCGHVAFFDPAVDETVHEHLRERWGGEKYHIWTEGDPREVFADVEAEQIEERLEDLGYF